jgi:hypothetical protein
MKNFYLLLLLMFLFGTTKAQELIVGGDMTSEDSWTGFSCSDTADQSTYEFNYKKGVSVGRSTLNLSNLQKSLYIMSVTSGTKTESQKFILK